MNTLVKEKPEGGFLKVACAIALLIMPLVHIAEAHLMGGTVKPEAQIIVKYMEALSVLGPGVFMVCFGMNLSSNKTTVLGRKRGIQLLIIHFGLNVFRFGIMAVIGVLLGIISIQEAIAIVLQCDIYSFVGLFYICYYYLKKWKLSTKQLCIIGLAAMIAGIIISENIYVQPTILSVALSHFVPISSYAYFPLVIWFIYPCIGIVIREKIMTLNKRDRDIAFGIILGLSLATLCFAANRFDVIDVLEEYTLKRHYGMIQVLFALSITGVEIGISYFVYEILPFNKVEKYLLYLYSNIFPYFIIQWIVVAISTYLMGAFYVAIFGDYPYTGIAGIIITYAIDLAVILYIVNKKGIGFAKAVLRLTDYERKRKQS